MDLLTIVLAVATLFGALAAIPSIWEFVDARRGQIKQVTARIDQKKYPVGGNYRHGVLAGGSLTIRNSSARWPVRDVMVTGPDSLAGLEIGNLGPNEKFVEDLPQAVMQDLAAAGRVTLQLRDRNDTMWSWAPQEQKLERIPKRLPVLAAAVQRSSRHWPQAWHQRFFRLPRTLKKILWGYDPAGES